MHADPDSNGPERRRRAFGGRLKILEARVRALGQRGFEVTSPIGLRTQLPGHWRTCHGCALTLAALGSRQALRSDTSSKLAVHSSQSYVATYGSTYAPRHGIPPQWQASLPFLRRVLRRAGAHGRRWLRPMLRLPQNWPSMPRRRQALEPLTAHRRSSAPLGYRLVDRGHRRRCRSGRHHQWRRQRGI